MHIKLKNVEVRENYIPGVPVVLATVVGLGEFRAHERITAGWVCDRENSDLRTKFQASQVERVFNIHDGAGADEEVRGAIRLLHNMLDREIQAIMLPRSLQKYGIPYYVETGGMMPQTFLVEKFGALPDGDSLNITGWEEQDILDWLERNPIQSLLQFNDVPHRVEHGRVYIINSCDATKPLNREECIDVTDWAEHDLVTWCVGWYESKEK